MSLNFFRTTFSAICGTDLTVEEMIITIKVVYFLLSALYKDMPMENILYTADVDVPCHYTSSTKHLFQVSQAAD